MEFTSSCFSSLLPSSSSPDVSTPELSAELRCSELLRLSTPVRDDAFTLLAVS